MCVSLIQAMQLPMPILGSVSTDRDFFGFIYFKTRGFQTKKHKITSANSLSDLLILSTEFSLDDQNGPSSNRAEYYKAHSKLDRI